jgi:hypothetical protein
MNSLTLKPAGAITRSTFPKSQGSREPVTPTELAASQAVTAAADGSAQGRYSGGREGAAQQQPVSHDCLIDPQAQEVISRSTDMQAEQVSPDAALKLRAYRNPANESESTDCGAVAKTA